MPVPLLYRCALQMCTRTSTITHDNTLQASTPQARVGRATRHRRTGCTQVISTTRHRRTGCTQVIGRKRSSSALPRPLFAAPQAHVHAGIVAQPCHRDKRFGIRCPALSRAKPRPRAKMHPKACSITGFSLHAYRQTRQHAYLHAEGQTDRHTCRPTHTHTHTHAHARIRRITCC